MDDNEKHDGRCYACGGAVDAKGMALGGLVEDGVNLDDESSQMEMAEKSEKGGARDFIAAVRRQRMAR